MFTFRKVFAGRPVLLHTTRDTQDLLGRKPVIPNGAFLLERGGDGWHAVHRGLARGTHGTRDVDRQSQVVSAIDPGYDQVGQRFENVANGHIDRGRWRRREADCLQAIRQREIFAEDRLGRINRVSLAALVVRWSDDDDLADRLKDLRDSGEPGRTHAIVIADQNSVRRRLIGPLRGPGTNSHDASMRARTRRALGMPPRLSECRGRTPRRDPEDRPDQ